MADCIYTYTATALANEIEIYGVECVGVTRVSRAAVYSTAPVSIINDGSECQYDSARAGGRPAGARLWLFLYVFRRRIYNRRTG